MRAIIRIYGGLRSRGFENGGACARAFAVARKLLESY